VADASGGSAWLPVWCPTPLSVALPKLLRGQGSLQCRGGPPLNLCNNSKDEWPIMFFGDQLLSDSYKHHLPLSPATLGTGFWYLPLLYRGQYQALHGSTTFLFLIKTLTKFSLVGSQ
jgi:hypothetical protein